MAGRNIPIGNSPASFTITLSAIAFVKVYVFGHAPNNL